MTRAADLTDFPRCGNNAAVIRHRRLSRVSVALLLATACGFAPGCTLFDNVVPGLSFTPDQPKAEVTVVGEINIDRATASSTTCSAGTALLWGIARNTGDLDVDDIYIIIEALNSGGGVVGTYRTHVFNGTITEITPGTETTPAVSSAGTSLKVKESGSFAVCTGQPFEAVAATTYRTDFIVIDKLK
jgi:hypothetical protein